MHLMGYVFIVQHEVKLLLENNPSRITIDGEFKYVTNGVIDTAKDELAQPLSGDRNTSSLQPYLEWRATPPLSDIPQTLFSSLGSNGGSSSLGLAVSGQVNQQPDPLGVTP